MNPRSSIREFLVEQRRAIGWTQEELAERSGLSVRTIRNLEIGTISNPRRASVELLLKALQPTPAHGVVPQPDGVSPDGARVLVDVREFRTPVGPPPAWRGRRPDREPLIGRAVDVAHLAGAVGECPLVVLVGPGGAGKTRLALATAEHAGASFADGVAVVELGLVAAERHDPARAAVEVRRAVGAAGLHLPDLPSDPPDQPAGRLHHQSAGQPGRPAPGTPDPHLLVVLDNVEHVLHAVVPVTQQILSRYPNARIIATSRRPLAVTPSYVWEVGPLDVGDGPGDRPGDGPAVELFLRRAAAACPGLDLSGRQAEVAELCRRLEGLPLAIELAAHQIRSVPLHALLGREPIARILGQTRAAALPHQRTLAESVRWSYDLLGEGPRQLLHHLAGRFDRFTLEDLERVPPRGHPTGASGLIGPLADLVDASLIHVRRGTQYQYRFFGFVREFVNGLSDGSVA